ncbi:MAG: ABC transporter ATP-binding protein [Bdellovibrionaceae bacterium]|nr:ABC transporter ATP-binding protein [Pseudobdellovibrionaceae bacterium]
MLTISNLKKTYPNGVKALNGVNLKIGKGMFGLLGPNGAGKSSLMRTIATLQDPDEGAIVFNDLNVLGDKEKMRSMLGYLPQEFGVYPTSSAEDLLNHLAILKGLTDVRVRKETVDRLLELTNLSKHRKKNLGGYSGGMKQRFGIAQALLAHPKIIIVDEPTAGLDPDERDRFHNLLSQIGENVTVILSTHIVSDVSDLCQDMAIINNGRVLVQQSPLLAIEKMKGKVWQKIFDKSEVEGCSSKYKVISMRLTHGKVMMRVYGETLPDNGFVSATPDLEDVYFAHIRSYIQ